MTSEERLAAAKAHIAGLVSVVTQQREQIAQQRAYIRELSGRLVKDSHNSAKPPTSDGLARKPRKTKSLRKPSGKKPGGQVGHQGETLRLQATPDVVVEHRSTHCTHCQAPLDAAAPVVLRQRRQVHELPVVRVEVTEHQAPHVRRSACGQVRPHLAGGGLVMSESAAPGRETWEGVDEAGQRGNGTRHAGGLGRRGRVPRAGRDAGPGGA